MIHTDFILAAAGNPVSNLAAEFGVQWQYLIAQMFSFAIVAAGLYFFAFKPVISTLDSRQKKIDDGLRYADEMKTKLAEAERQQAETIKKAQLDAQQIIEDTRRSAK